MAAGVTRLILDAGALVGLERQQPAMWRLLRAALEEGIHILVAAPVLAQV